MKLDPIQPRYLRYRSHLKLYVFAFAFLLVFFLSYWSIKFYSFGFRNVWNDYSVELLVSSVFFIGFLYSYFFWFRPKLKKSVQVFPDHLLVHSGRKKTELRYLDIESAGIVCWSIFYIKMKDGDKHYFNSGFERVDYVWEGVYSARPDLMGEKVYDDYRLKLIQYDHHQKRKEWFFRHKMLDVFIWAILPAAFIGFAYLIQSREIVIHQQTLYFFRLTMFAFLVLLSTTFLFSLTLKKFVFDKRISARIESQEDKARDVEFEGMVLQRSKLFQIVTAGFFLAMLIKMDVNLYSLSKVRDDISSFQLKKGNTILIDNRYNCLNCKYHLSDGDYVVFGRGVIGQILATEGDMVGQIAEDRAGRTIASENILEVPMGHVAVKAGNGKDISFVKIPDLIGKIQN